MKRRFLTAVAAVTMSLTPFALPAVASEFHPPVQLLDSAGQPVATTGQPVSPMRTCGGCHDTGWIAAHSPHAMLGLDQTGEASRSFDSGPGAINRFDPITYDRVAFKGEFTIGIADWLRTHGGMHTGGGLAVQDADGKPIAKSTSEVFAKSRDDQGRIVDWDWETSGVAEMNCFLCHLPDPDDAARRTELAAGRFGNAAQATLGKTDLTPDKDGLVDLPIQSPAASNCGICHGDVVARPDQPFFLPPDASRRETLTTGSIFAPGRISRSGMNIAERDSLARPWDVHAERMLTCTDCHGSTNDPSLFAESSSTRPDHLRFDARRIDFGDFLKQPSHEFARGHSAQTPARRDLDNSMRECVDCHQAGAVHSWLPYKDRHFSALACEACHVPVEYGPTLASVDWTVLDADGEPVRRYRGIEGDPQSPKTLVHGYRPVLLPRPDGSGHTRLTPHNLVTSWFWVDGQTGAPVPRATLERVFLDGDGLTDTARKALDATGDGKLSELELGLFSPHQVKALAEGLTAAGVNDPRIEGEVQPFGTHHGVATGRWATRECTTCHGPDSRTSEDFYLAEFAPGGVLPVPVTDSGVQFAGNITLSECGHVIYRPDPGQAGRYLFGTARARAIDHLGWLTLLIVLLGVVLHGGLRFVLATSRRNHEVRS